MEAVVVLLILVALPLLLVAWVVVVMGNTHQPLELQELQIQAAAVAALEKIEQAAMAVAVS